MTEKFIIIGKNGQLGSQLTKLLGNNAVAFSHSDCEFDNLKKTSEYLGNIKASAVFNASAYTNVDEAESNYHEALKANAEIPFCLAKYCKSKDIPLIHFSTDYVYSGDGNNSNNEDAPPSPINKYGKSKLEGEKNIIKTGCKHLIFRTSWVYDGYNKNFLTTMLKLAKEREELSIVADQIGAPTYAYDLAEKSIEAFYNATKELPFPSGIYNLCSQDTTNWNEFACKIFEYAKQHGIDLKINKVNKIKSDEYPTPAKRPLNSRLDCSKVKSVLNIQMPNWQNSLEKCMEQLIENSQNTDR
jgi:dTDP-4-dehydrorhamnose reductase